MELRKTSLFFGHEKQEAVLVQSLRSGKIFPTWIFCGPFGIGKSTLAHRFAKCLLSEVIPSGNHLDRWSENIGRHVDQRTHPDFFVLEQREESVSIDETRNLTSKIFKNPSMSKWRFMILENASNLNRNISNALLKLLEEPPKNSVIVLICENIGLLPKTLISRASVLNFKPLSTEPVCTILKNKNIENAEKLAQLSGGSVGYALYLQANNGLEIYDRLLHAFDFSTGQPNYTEALKYIIENNYIDNFRIIRESLIRILKIYADLLNGVAEKYPQKDCTILQTAISNRNLNTDTEMKKILEILHMINRGEAMMLDKKSVLLYVFEKFFSRYHEKYVK